MDLNEMLIFAQVVQAGTFTAAAARLGMPKQTVSRKLSELEERLKSRLVQRTTRKLSLTDAGRTFYEYCARIANEVEDAERAVSGLQESPRGLLRITAPVNVDYFLGPIISDFLKRYPEIRVEMFCTARVVDLVEESFDVAIRAGRLTDSTLIARNLGTTAAAWLLVAAPAYLKKRGRPRSPEDLKKHDILFFGAGLKSVVLRLDGGGRSAQVELSARAMVNDMEVVYALATAGLGVALLPTIRCIKDLRSGRLRRVLHNWHAASIPIHVVYPSTRHLALKVKSFVDHLNERMRPSPWDVRL